MILYTNNDTRTQEILRKDTEYLIENYSKPNIVDIYMKIQRLREGDYTTMFGNVAKVNDLQSHIPYETIKI